MPETDWEHRHAVYEHRRLKNMLRARAKAIVVNRHRDEYEEELAMMILAEDGMWR